MNENEILKENETMPDNDAMNENEKNMQDFAKKKGIMTPMDAAETVSSGKIKLLVPIEDGEMKYDTLKYDFNALTGWELAKAIDDGSNRGQDQNSITDAQALSLFAVAAAKATGGLDAKDIKDRLNSRDAIAAMSVASIFFKGTLLAGSLRITKE